MQLPGKRNRRVPVLLMPDVKLAMDTLVDKCQVCGISPKNPYFFANDSHNGHVDNWQVLKDSCRGAQLERPELITSTNLQKYVATVTQVNADYIRFCLPPGSCLSMLFSRAVDFAGFCQLLGARHILLYCIVILTLMAVHKVW